MFNHGDRVGTPEGPGTVIVDNGLLACVMLDEPRIITTISNKEDDRWGELIEERSTASFFETPELTLLTDPCEVRDAVP